MLSQITPLILTYNEAPNIERTLSRLKWAKQILVVDSFSTDETCDLVKKLPQARIVQREFDNHTNQWNFGLDHVRTEWVLSLDADYFLSDELVQELAAWSPEQGVAAYFARFRYCVLGRPLRASLYPPRAVLFCREACRYVDAGHTQVLSVNGKASFLRGWIYHDDRKPLERWLREQDRYARLEAEHLLKRKAESRKQKVETEGAGPKAEKLKTEMLRSENLGAEDEGRGFSVSAFQRFSVSDFARPSWADRVRRKIVFAPFLVFFYTLLGKRLILDGWPGWFYVFQRTYAEVLLSLRLLEQKLKR